jgi:hypothetical protein
MPKKTIQRPAPSMSSALKGLFSTGAAARAGQAIKDRKSKVDAASTFSSAQHSNKR